MTEKLEKNGKCLCGKVKVYSKNIDAKLGACHCTMCRNWTGGPYLAVDAGTEVSFEGEDNITEYDSSAWACRGFCQNCGSTLYYKLKEKNQYILSAGLFENSDGFVFDHQIFIDEQPSYYQFANKTSDMTGAEVFAKHS